MTVSYQYDVASSTSGGFTRLLFKWKGSLYKLVYRELVLFVFLYGLMSVIYRHVFNDEQKRSFERLALYCDTFMNYIPLSFILGFYVSFVASRWWQQYMAIPWPDKLLHSIALHVTGYDEKGRMLRRTMVRYLNLSFVLVLRSISSAVKRRFPTFDHIVEAGFMTSTELQIYKTVPCTEFNTYWVPFTWFTALVKDARYQKRIADPHGAKLIMEEFNDFRQMCGMLWSFDWVSIPLVYTQVVTIATYAFFLACIIGRQYVEKSPIPYKVKPDLYIPYFTLLQFFFYMGLLKVAEQLINPFGDDDEDFELNWIIDRHMKVSYLIVDTLMLKTPPLSKDIYFDQESPVLPYTEAAVPYRKKAYRGSVAHMTVPEDQQTFILPDIDEETDDEKHENEDSANKAKIAGGLMSSTTGMFRQDSAAVNGDTGHLALLVPDQKGGGGSPRLGTANKFSSSVASRRGSRLAVPAGTKGAVGSALVAVGANQVLLATGPDSLTQARGEDNVDYVVIPMDSNYFDIKDGPHSDGEAKTPQLNRKHSFKLPASIKSRLAMRKKPVMKWKPYIKPPDVSETSKKEGEDGLNEDQSPYGCYEEECAFMWRTIDDSDTAKQLYFSPDVAKDVRLSPIDLDKRHVHHQDHRVLSGYEGVRTRLPTKIGQSLGDDLSASPNFNHPAYMRRGVRRTRCLVRGRPRFHSLIARQHSLPHLVCSSCGVANPRLVRCISENSVFLDAVVERIRRSGISSNSLLSLNSLPASPRGKHRRKSSSSRYTKYNDDDL